MGKSGGTATSVRERASRGASSTSQGFKGSAAVDRHIAAWNKLSFEERYDISHSPGGYKAWVAQHFGKKDVAWAKTLTASGKRVGRPPKSTAAKARSVAERKAKASVARTSRAKSAAAKREAGMPHAMTAAERAHAGLPREAQPGEELTVVSRDSGREYNIYEGLNPSLLQTLYGDHQLGAALTRYTAQSLKTAAQAVQTAHPGTKPADARSKAGLVSYMTRVLTNGRYSADFAKTARSASSTGVPNRSRAPAAAPRAVRPANSARIELTPVSRPALADWFRADRGVESNASGLYGRQNPYYLNALYGNHQLKAALGRYGISTLREAADVVNRRNGWTSRSKNYVRGTSKSVLADRIAQAVIAHPSGPFVADNLYS